ncbi:MAG: sulfatase-like hydrolase/transferase [Rubripirellula sp.]
MTKLTHVFLLTLAALLPAWQTIANDTVADDTVADRPNIVWITAEDMSPTLGCYDDAFADTPFIDRLASQSARYTHAFATAPVCSPSRACLINGCIATTQGTHPMRSQLPIPKEMKGFPELLRAAGYYTTNNVKTDYNSAAEPAIKEASWNECSANAHWRNRKPDQPFFSVFNLMTTHQSRTMVWPYEQFQEEVQSDLLPTEIHDPNRVPLPPYYPDTPTVRKTVARYYDCVTMIDQRVGAILVELVEEGLLDDTIIFFYSDHGSGMPRHKRALFDSGMRVPLLVRLPEKHRHLARSVAAKGDVDRLVNFEDFAPTVLSIAGLKTVPDSMSGQAFLGPLDTDRRELVFGHRDRVDEVMDMARSARSHDFLYIRNFMPHLGYNQQNAWSDQGEIRRDFYALHASGDATPAQAQYLAKTRPREELYDCVTDPMNLQNLAGDSRYGKVLAQLRDDLRTHMVESRDLGLVPEIELWRHAKAMPPMAWAKSEAFQAESILSAAELVGTDDFEAIGQALENEDASIRYWGAVSCTAATKLPPPLRDALVKHFEDPSPAVAIEAAGAIAKHERDQDAMSALVAWFDNDDRTVALHAARTVELLADPTAKSAMQQLADKYENKAGDLAWFIRFSTSGYLNRQK